MKVLDVMREYKDKDIAGCWLKQENGYEYIYGLTGYSSIENPEYIKKNKEVLFAEVVDVHQASKDTIRIVYKL
jgi:hypothetical protein